MKEVTLDNLATEFNSLKKEVSILKKKIDDKDLYLSPKEKREYLQNLNEYERGKTFSFEDIEKERKLKNV